MFFFLPPRSLSLFLAGGWRILIAPLVEEFSAAQKDTRRKLKSTKRLKNSEVRSFRVEEKIPWSGFWKKKVNGQRLSRGPRRSKQQRSSMTSEQSQVSTPWDKPTVTLDKNCLGLTKKHDFLFSEEELSCWQTCPQFDNTVNRKSQQVSQKTWCFSNQFPTAGQLQYKRLRQPQNMVNMANLSPGMAPLDGQGIASQTLEDMASLPLRKVSTNWENRWPIPFSHTDVHQSWRSRPWWPQDGCSKHKAGTRCHGMDPSWVISSFSGSQNLEHSKGGYRAGASSSPEVSPQGPFFERLRKRMT